MGQLNQIGLLGNLTRDPELKFTNEGVAICDMGLAVNRRWTDKEGKETENVDFFNISCWNSMAENCASSLKKGDRVLISERCLAGVGILHKIDCKLQQQENKYT